ncbi:MAG TPA: lysylphosphatidylglycerol synthase transmembrane domain-containing protein [Terriglobia bacterium]|nr:lysylphosphatidylglycerol synthase transmembrane domain-containing protein [Terriglobia bacterium]
MRVTPIVRAGFSIVFVAIILWRVPINTLWYALQNLNGVWLWPALASAFVALGIRIFKWQQLLKAGGSRTPLRDVMRSLFGGFALGVVTPGRLGEFARCLFTPEAERPTVIALNVLDRILDSWSVATYAVVSLFLIGRPLPGTIALVGWAAFIPALLISPRLIFRLGESPRWNKFIGAKLPRGDPVLEKGVVATFAGWALLATSMDVITFYFVLRAFHPTAFMTAPTTYPWIMMASAIPLTLGGLGLREGAAVALLHHYAITPAEATEVALLLFVFLSLLPALCGGLLILLARKGDNTSTATLIDRRLKRKLSEDLRIGGK